MKVYVSFAIVVAMILLVTISCAGPTKVVAPEEEKWVIIGNTADLSGPVAGVVVPAVEGFIAGFHEINERGGLQYTDPKTGQVGRVKIKHVYADDNYKVERAISNYNNFKQQGAIAFYNFSTGACLALKEITIKDEIVQIHVGNTREMMYPKNLYNLTTSPAYTDTFGALVDYLVSNWKETRPLRLAMLTGDSPFGRAMYTPATVAYMKEKGVEFLGIRYASMTDVDLTPPVKELANLGADYIVTNLTASFGANIIKAIYRLGLQDKVHFAANAACFDDDLVKLAGEQANGAIGVNFVRDMRGDCRVCEKLSAQLRKTYPAKPILYNHSLGAEFPLFLEIALTETLSKRGYPITGKNLGEVVATCDGKGIWASEDHAELMGPLDLVTTPKDAAMAHQTFAYTIENGKMKFIKTLPTPSLSWKE
jgi:ABC-type branched-subunit amino acid transport system substrate-binding protein